MKANAKIHHCLFAISLVCFINMFRLGKPEHAELWLLCGAICFFSFLFACMFKAIYDDALEGHEATKDAIKIWVVWKLFSYILGDRGERK